MTSSSMVPPHHAENDFQWLCLYSDRRDGHQPVVNTHTHAASPTILSCKDDEETDSHARGGGNNSDWNAGDPLRQLRIRLVSMLSPIFLVQPI